MMFLQAIRLPLVIAFFVNVGLVIRVPFTQQPAYTQQPARATPAVTPDYPTRALLPEPDDELSASASQADPPQQSGPTQSSDPPAVPPADGPALVIMNLEPGGGEIRFLVDGEPCVLGPGQSHQFSGPHSWHVQFQRGAGFGSAEQTVSPGVYAFKSAAQGWSLVDVPQGRP
jgi:hypothetical protein